jgi:Ca2+/Na+ antiporter
MPQQNNAGTLALVFGILSIVCCAIIFGPLAIIKGNEAKDSNGKIGKILGIVGLVLWAIGIIINIIGGFAFFNEINTYGY